MSMVPLSPEQLLCLRRAALADGGAAAADARDWESLQTHLSEEDRAAVAERWRALLGPLPGEGEGPRASPRAGGEMQDLLQERAALRLKLQSEAARYSDLESAHRREQSNHKEAIESLGLQQKKIKELQESRSQLLEDLSRVEAQLRRQINDTEQWQLRYEKLKGSRGAIGDQVTGQAEQINALRAENEELRAQIEATRKDRDRQTADAEAAARTAEGKTADAAFQQLWQKMAKEAPTVFLETHVPNMQTFSRLCDAMVEFVRAFGALEGHVHEKLRDLRQVGDESDRLNRFYLMLRKTGLQPTLCEYLSSGRGKGNFTNLLRAIQAWSRAFGTGLYKVIVQSPAVIAEELNWRKWPIKTGGVFGNEDVAIGRHFKETAQRNVPDVVGNRLRKQAGEMSHEDYNSLMRPSR